ncbi:hypothetical protein G6549_25305 [Bacillus sp. MM2020_1]|nr:hypothetical protein [Bacillus sp. MM2020_1]
MKFKQKKKKITTEFTADDRKFIERDFLQEYLNENAKKRRKENIIYSFILVGIILLLMWGLKGCVQAIHDGRIAKAGRYIEVCENPSLYVQWDVNGKDCDDARKIYNNYTDEEWEKEKENLVEFDEVTEHDGLYYVLKEKLYKQKGDTK